MGQWTGPSFPACLREPPASVRPAHRRARTATEVLDQADVDQDVVHQLRVLIDAITPDP